jgi:hypothetical protein
MPRQSSTTCGAVAETADTGEDDDIAGAAQLGTCQRGSSSIASTSGSSLKQLRILIMACLTIKIFKISSQYLDAYTRMTRILDAYM